MRPLFFILSRFAALAALLALPIAVHAGWFDWFSGGADKAGTRAVRPASGALENAARHVRSLPAKADGVVLAAEGTQEGHWRFVNKAGEMLTVGTPDEMKRVLAVLYPAAKANARLSIHMTEATIFAYPAALKALPAGSELFVVVGPESYRIARRGDGAAERIYAEVRSNLVIEMTDRQVFDETVWQLARPLNTAGVRVLALEPGGPPTLSGGPRLDPATKRALVDVIDPASLPAAMSTVRAQTLLLTGRIEGELLYVKPSSGSERSVLLRDLIKAAEEADINLIVLHAASTPRQPGGRNWLWQKVEVSGLEDALQRARVADFLNGLGANRRLAVAAAPAGNRAALDVKVVPDLPGVPASGPVGELFSGLVSDIAGRVVTAAVFANVRSAERQHELDRRLFPGVPSLVQIGYLGLMLLGLFGVPVSRLWWQRLWPPEVATDYAGRAGYRAARVVRSLAYVFVFLPLTALAAAPHNLTTQIWDGVMTPVRWWHWLTGLGRVRRSETGSGDGREPAPAEDNLSLLTPAANARDWPVADGARRLGNTRPSR